MNSATGPPTRRDPRYTAHGRRPTECIRRRHGLLPHLVWLVAVALLTAACESGGRQSPGSTRATSSQTANTCTDAAARDRVSPSVVHVEVETATHTSTGTGVVIDNSGLVLTAEHVVRGRTGVCLTFADGVRTRGIVVHRSPDDDVALVETYLTDYRPITWGDERTLKPNERLLALGYPPGTRRGDPSLTGGLFSAHVTHRGVPLVETDTPLDHGNSGGPLFTQCGEVVGLVRFGLIDDQKRNFAVAASRARAVALTPAAATASASRGPSQTAASPPVVTPTPTPEWTPQPMVRPTRSAAPSPVTTAPESIAITQAIRTSIERSHDVWIEAMGHTGTTERLQDVYADGRLTDITELVNGLRSAGQYRVYQRNSLEFISVHWDGGSSGRAETVEDWSDTLYDRNGRVLGERRVRERDVYSLRRINGQWRIVADEVQHLDVPAGAWFTVIVDSLPVSEGRTRQDAERVASQVRAQGFEAGVLLSTDYPQSLRPGHWVAYSGRFASQSETLTHLSRVRASGHPAAYLREIDR